MFCGPATPCPRCGLTWRPPYKRLCRGAVRERLQEKYGERVEPPGLGDHTERLLARLGITEELVKTVKKRFGLAPTCRCPRRKKWLNKVGKWWKRAKGERSSGVEE